MAKSLKVLVVESDMGAASVADDALRAAGHSVVRCHEPGAHAFPCKALEEGEACPLEGEVVDVVLDVRRRPRAEPSPFEDGARCGLQHHIPLVVAGRIMLNPFENFATEIVVGNDVVAACERAAAAALPRHSQAARVALGEVLARRGIAADGSDVQVYRRSGALVVETRVNTRIDHTTKSVASARMIGAIREVDRTARGIDVCFEINDEVEPELIG